MSEATAEALPSANGGDAGELRARLDRSRTALLEMLANLTERDFASEIEDGRSVLDLLASLAPAERVSAASALPGGTEAAHEASARRRGGAMLPPQVIHDLSGARRRTLIALDRIEAAGGVEDDSLEEFRAIAEREEQAAAAIRAHFDEPQGGA